MGEQTVLTPEQEAYNQRVQRVETAIALKEPDRGSGGSVYRVLRAAGLWFLLCGSLL